VIALERTKKQILRSLLAGPKTFWRLIREQDSHLAHFTAVLGEIVREGLVCNSDHRLGLTEKGRKAAREWKLQPLQPLGCPTCGGKGLVLEGRFSEVERRFRELAQRRPPAVPEFDQGCVDPTSTVARVALMYLRGDLEGRDLFVLGDDDLTSVAAALTGMAGHITVLEADERLVAFIADMAERQGWSNLEVRQYDVRHPLPAELHGRFDTFVVDPVETLPGIGLFLSRCVQALKGAGSAGYLGLTHLEASRQKWFAIQRLILNMNLVITDTIRDFHEYELERDDFLKRDYPLLRYAPGHLPPPDLNWYTSSFIRLEAVAQPRVIPDYELPQGPDLYFDAEAYATLPMARPVRCPAPRA